MICWEDAASPPFENKSNFFRFGVSHLSTDPVLDKLLKPHRCFVKLLQPNPTEVILNFSEEPQVSKDIRPAVQLNLGEMGLKEEKIV